MREGMQLHWRREGATRFEDYLARFDSKRRNQMKRELRRVKEAGITVETLPPEGHTREIARAMHSFYASTVDKHGPWGRLYLNEQFFDWLVDHFKDRLAWVVARDARGTPIGGAFNVAKGKRMYGRYWGTRLGRAQPALRPLLLRGHPLVHRARHRRLRGRRRTRRAQAFARVRPDHDAVGPLACGRQDAPRAGPLARARKSTNSLISDGTMTIAARDDRRMAVAVAAAA